MRTPGNLARSHISSHNNESSMASDECRRAGSDAIVRLEAQVNSTEDGSDEIYLEELQGLSRCFASLLALAKRWDDSEARSPDTATIIESSTRVAAFCYELLASLTFLSHAGAGRLPQVGESLCDWLHTHDPHDVPMPQIGQDSCSSGEPWPLNTQTAI